MLEIYKVFYKQGTISFNPNWDTLRMKEDTLDNYNWSGQCKPMQTKT